MDFINSLLPKIQDLGYLGYWIVLLVSLGESLAFIGLVIPGTVFVVLMGFLSASGILDLGDLIWFSAIGAIMGDGISFYLGGKGTSLFKKDSRVFRMDYLEKGERFFKRYGGKSVFLGRFIGPLRPVMPFVAGLFKMKSKEFFLYNITSAFLWAAGCLLLGYFFGGIWNTIVVWSTRAQFFLLVLLVIAVIFLTIKWLLVKRGRKFFLLVQSIGASVWSAIKENKEIKRIVEKNPAFFAWIGRRVAGGEITGLPLTLLTVAFVYFLFLFFGTAESVLKSGILYEMDIRIENLLYMFRNSFFVQVFTWISLLGASQVVFVFVSITSILLFLWNKKTYLVPLWVSFLGSQASSFISKLLFHRARPELAVYQQESFSFPSGHAIAAVSFYGFLLYFIWKNTRNWNRKANAFFLCFVIIAIVGFSRLYLGVHYLSDVAGGYILGLLWVIIAISLGEWKLYRRKIKTLDAPKLPLFSLKSISLALFLAAAVFYVVFGFFYKLPMRNIERTQKVFAAAEDPLDLFSQHKLSRYSETLSGSYQAPVSFIILARTDGELLDVFQKSSWHLADPPNADSLLKIASAVILNESYPAAPMTPSFWNSQVHDFGFEKPTEKDSVRARHHARFWRTGVKTPEGKNIYVGVASLDVGIKYLVAHTISPDIDTEREFVFEDLKRSGAMFSFRKEKLVDPVLGKNAAGDQFFTDGEAYIIDIN